MANASALPMIGIACCNWGMLQGEKLVDALRFAIDLKTKGGAKYGPTALGKALGITQPSASDLMKHGRIKKERYFMLVEAFKDVVGPDHWGLPFSAREFDVILAYRKLPSGAQDAVFSKLAKAASASQSITDDLADEEAEAPHFGNANAA